MSKTDNNEICIDLQTKQSETQNLWLLKWRKMFATIIMIISLLVNVYVCKKKGFHHKDFTPYANLILTISWICSITIVLPQILKMNKNHRQFIILLIVSILLFGACMYSFYKAVLTEPGYVHADRFDKYLGVGRKRYCPTCNLWKPPRSQHCAVCNKCVLKYDHHCPLIGNCVGARNQKYVLLLIPLKI
eukprot:496900_1